MDNNKFNNLNKQRSKIVIVITILGVLLLSIIAYLIYIGSEEQEKEKPQKSDLAVTLSVPEPAPQEEERYTVPEGWRVYQNARFGFILAYPVGVKVREVDEGKGAITIILEDVQRAQGLQMFIVPYSDKAISEERFLRDIPSGVRTNVEKVFINGVEGVAFDSRDTFLGETKEVWFIKGGFLYEVTAPKSLDGWLAEILATWKFQ